MRDRLLFLSPRLATSVMSMLIMACFLLATIILLLFIIPILITSTNTYADTSSTDPTISIVPAGDLTLNLNPSASGGVFGAASANVTISTTNITGYTLTMNTETTDTDLKNNKIDYTDPTKADLKITNLSTTTAESSFANNKWGYNVSKSGTYIKGAANTYVPVPNSDSQQSDKEIEVTDAAGSSTYTFNYGVKADLSLPAGDYSNTLVYSATANPLPTMQDFNYTACQALTTDETVTMVDSRDGSEYTVAKLRDGNCWMTQNLTLGSSAAMNLTQADSNVGPSGFTLPASVSEGSWAGSTTNPEFFDYAGKYPSQQATNKYGNYYNWSAATAGSGSSTSGADAKYDICPKGWHLPSAGTATTTGNEFYNMISNYITTGSWNGSNWSGVTTTNFTNAPVSLVFPGNYYGNLYDQGTHGLWPSSTASPDSTHEYYLQASSNGDVYPYKYNYWGKGSGLPIRCLLDKPTLYNKVAKMNKGTQTLADMQAVITKPTSNDPTTDTSNSGVYKYDATTFGTASDAANTHGIYYYRGVLDSDLTDSSSTGAGYVGSSGDGAYYPNYVVLSSASSKSNLATSDTCWRIVRTTGSGGVKMVYNGKWTGSTCANAGADANAVSDVYFNRRKTSSSTDDYDTKGRIIYVGYNYSSTSSHQTGTSAVANSTLFVNSTKSNLRTKLESWYASNMTAYTSKLETNAGWCNDRTTYNSSYTSTSSNVPYKTSSATVYFGAYKRNRRSGQSEKLSLTCTNTADRLTTSNGMSYPAAPLTADEAALAGSGFAGTYGSASTYSSNYHYNSYLRSGITLWLLSPSYRTSSGNVYEFFLGSAGSLSNSYVSNVRGVRPSISLKSDIIPSSGSGTATDPWIVNP